MIKIGAKKDCCGCTSCANVCAHGAIKMIPDRLGFLYPSINVESCINCGLCEKVCQFKDDYEVYENLQEPFAFGMRLTEEQQLFRSQSGGAFYMLAKYFISLGGVVYGAAFDVDWSVHHIRATDLRGLESLRMSKYVQSDLKDCFVRIKKELREGLLVLFSGTACQVAGLKSYIPRNLHKSLFCVDIICHGVPSPSIWNDYIKYLEEKYKSPIKKVCFRNKRFGWHGARESYLFLNGVEIVRDTYNKMYFSGLSMRECCSSCKFTNTRRVGDITIGDFWGIPKDSIYEQDAKGLSLILVSSRKGEKLLHEAKEKCILFSVPLSDCLQPQLQYPSKLSTRYRDFVRDYEERGLKYILNHYGDVGWRYKVNQSKLQIRIYISKFYKKIKLVFGK